MDLHPAAFQSQVVPLGPCRVGHARQDHPVVALRTNPRRQGEPVIEAEGAHVAGIDYGQYGGQPVFPPIPNVTPRNACGDPPGGVGGPVASNTAEGGAFRSQDLLTDGDPTGWNGAIVRIDPDTGHHYDDTKRYIEELQIDLGSRRKIYEENARRVYPRLDAALKAKGR